MCGWCHMSAWMGWSWVVHLGNMCPVSLTSLQGMWCFTSGLFIHVWMFTISFRSSSDIEELSISSGRTTHAVYFDLLNGRPYLTSSSLYLCRTPPHHQCWRLASPPGKVYQRGRCCSRVCLQREKKSSAHDAVSTNRGLWKRRFQKQIKSDDMKTLRLLW